MDLKTLLFTFDGRVNRGKYWLAALCYFITILVAMTLAFLLHFVGLILAGILYVIMMVSGVFVGIKRLHDRDKSGWWLLLFYLVPGAISGLTQAMGMQSLAMIGGLISLAISVWAFVELGCLRGTVGPNQYGPDPLVVPATA